MDKEAKILDYAQELGEACNRAEYVATTDRGEVYGLSLVDADGFPLPVGLPRLVIANGDKYTLIRGDEALKLLDSLGLEE